MKVRIIDGEIRFRLDEADVDLLRRGVGLRVGVLGWTCSLDASDAWRVAADGDGLRVVGGPSLKAWADGDDVTLAVDVGGVRVVVERDLRP